MNLNTCLNGGTCYDTYGSFICECQPNYMGANCEKLIDTNDDERSLTCAKDKECNGEQYCVNGKCCEIVPDRLPHVCKTSVAMALDDCECLNGGSCTANSTVCICPPGYEGAKCENDIDECAQQPNLCGHGICVNQPGTFKCYCEPGK